MIEQQRQLGNRLRAIRRQQGMTLHDVEDRSGGQWKAVVVGSYERGDRAISIAKLARLAEFYGVPMHDLLPSETNDPTQPVDPDTVTRICLDLTRLPAPDADNVLGGMARYARRIQVERGDYNGRLMTIRRDDLHAIALAFGLDTADLIGELDRATALIR